MNYLSKEWRQERRALDSVTVTVTFVRVVEVSARKVVKNAKGKTARSRLTVAHVDEGGSHIFRLTIKESDIA
jgi:hypothetical protein